MRLAIQIRLLLLDFVLLPVQGVWAIDAGIDGSDSDEESRGHQRQRSHPAPLLLEDL